MGVLGLYLGESPREMELGRVYGGMLEMFVLDQLNKRQVLFCLE